MGADPDHPGKMMEKVGRKGGKNNSMGPVHQDNLERILNKEEDLFENKLTGDDGRNYYGWMIKRAARSKDNFEYMFKPDIPPLTTPHHWVDPNSAEGMKESREFAQYKAR